MRAAQTRINLFVEHIMASRCTLGVEATQAMLIEKWRDEQRYGFIAWLAPLAVRARQGATKVTLNLRLAIGLMSGGFPQNERILKALSPHRGATCYNIGPFGVSTEPLTPPCMQVCCALQHATTVIGMGHPLDWRGGDAGGNGNVIGMWNSHDDAATKVSP